MANCLQAAAAPLIVWTALSARKERLLRTLSCLWPTTVACASCSGYWSTAAHIEISLHDCTMSARTERESTHLLRSRVVWQRPPEVREQRELAPGEELSGIVPCALKGRRRQSFHHCWQAFAFCCPLAAAMKGRSLRDRWLLSAALPGVQPSRSWTAEMLLTGRSPGADCWCLSFGRSALQTNQFSFLKCKQCLGSDSLGWQANVQEVLHCGTASRQTVQKSGPPSKSGVWAGPWQQSMGAGQGQALGQHRVSQQGRGACVPMRHTRRLLMLLWSPAAISPSRGSPGRWSPSETPRHSASSSS